ncbi:hypothetical protein MASR2M15_00900 [Anaerolineales bacterium]
MIIALLGGKNQLEDGVMYLYPADRSTHNIYFTPLNNPDLSEQITFSEGGIYDFNLSHDGQFLVYSEKDAQSYLTDLFMMDLRSGQVQQLTHCVAEKADCRYPVFRPDGQMLAYERVEVDPEDGLGVSRVWLMDLSRTPYLTEPLFDNPQTLAYSPIWSGDGSKIAIYSQDLTNQGVLIYNFNAANDEMALKYIPSNQGNMGDLSADGNRFIMPDITINNGQAYNFLKLVDLKENLISELSSPEDLVDDVSAKWSPDGSKLAIARRLTGEKWTRGHQLYLLDMISDTIEVALYDERYNHGVFEWSPDGQYIVLQRFPLLTESGQVNADGLPEIWLYNVESKEALQLANNAYIPHFYENGKD